MTLRRSQGAIVLLLLTFVALPPRPADGAASPAWKELGGSASGNGISAAPAPQTAVEPSVAIGPDGRPVVAYAQIVGASSGLGSIVVTRWTGTAWQTLSSPGGIGQGFSPQIRVALSGTIYVAWFQLDAGNHQVHLLRRTAPGAPWEPVEGTGAVTDVIGVDGFSLAVDPDGNPVLAFAAPAQTGVFAPEAGILAGSRQVYVKRHQPATGWQYLGSDPFAGGGASNATSFPAGTGYVSHAAGSPSLTVDTQGAPVVAFVYEIGPGSSDIFVTIWDAGAWVALGPPVPQAGDGAAGSGVGPGGISATPGVSRSPSLGSIAGLPTVAWVEETAGNETYVFVRQWSGEDWMETAGSASGTGLGGPGRYSDRPQVADRPLGVDADTVVAWQSTPLAAPAVSQVFVKRLGHVATDVFEPMGPGAGDGHGISAATIHAVNPAAVASNAGATVVVWQDVKDGSGRSQVFLRQSAEARLSVRVSGAGRVLGTPGDIDCPENLCSDVYALGQVVSLQPRPGPDALFERWAGACAGSGACTVTMTADRSVNASFVGAATLTVARRGTGAALGTVNGPRIACGTDCDEKYKAGTPVTLTVALPAGTLFGGWGGDCAFRGKNTSCSLVMSANRSVSAEFAQRLHRLSLATAKPAGTVGHGDLGSVVAAAGGAPIGTCGPGSSGTCVLDVAYGASVLLNGAAAASNRFVTWQGAPCGGRANATCEFTMLANASVTALFRGVTAITVVKAGNGEGVVTGPGIDCGSDCIGEVFANTSATVRFTPAAGTLFRQWEGEVCQGVKIPACTFFASADVTITPRIERRRHQLTVSGRPNGSVVSINTLADPIACGADCTSVLDYGTTVALLALAEPDFVFSQWTGTSPCAAGAQATNARCVFVLNANVTATPSFRPGFEVTLGKIGTGSGTVTATGRLSPASATCGPSCTGVTFKAFDGHPVTLRASAGLGFAFVRFSGACTANVSVCTFTPTAAAHEVSVEFAAQPRTVNLSVVGDGMVAGNATCDPAASPCSVTELFGRELFLFAVPGDGNRLISWTGCSSVDGLTCRVKLTSASPAPLSVKAVFSFKLEVGLILDGAGTVAGTGIRCPEDCVETYAPGAAVRLTASPAAGSAFDGWIWSSDASVGPPRVITVTMRDNIHVDAAFIGPRTLAVTKTGSGDGTVTSKPAGINCDPDCKQVYPIGIPITLTLRAAPGSVAEGPSEVCGAPAPSQTCVFPMGPADATFLAAFNPPGHLRLHVDGPGAGRVVSADGRVDCGLGHSDCEARYAPGTSVRLTAVTGTGGFLKAWGGACAGANRTCTIVVGGTTDVHATFRPVVALTVTFTGIGTGGVATEPAALTPCTTRPSCTLLFEVNTSVTLAPLNDPGLFDGWGGDCSLNGRAPTCQLHMFANRSVTLAFLRDPVLVRALASEDLGIEFAGTGCFATCEAFFERGSVVTFEAAPRPGRVFLGWGHDCAAFGNASCALALSGNVTVSANVLVAARAITVDFSLYYGPYSGYADVVLTGASGSVVCIDPCTVLFPSDDTVTIEVFPDESSIFYGFDGDCDFDGYPCTVTLEHDRHVTVYVDDASCYWGCWYAPPPNDGAPRAPRRRAALPLHRARGVLDAGEDAAAHMVTLRGS